MPAKVINGGRHKLKVFVTTKRHIVFGCVNCNHSIQLSREVVEALLLHGAKFDDSRLKIWMVCDGTDFVKLA